MIENVFSRIARYGQEMTVVDSRGNCVNCKGFLQPADTMTEAFPDFCKTPGTGPEDRFLLLLSPEALAQGGRAECVQCGGRSYDVLGLQPIYCGQVLTHWEGVAREKGGSGWN